MIIGVGLPALALETTELASDEADVGEIDVAVDDVGDFVADVLGARQIGALDRGPQIVALGGCRAAVLLRPSVPGARGCV